MWEPGPPKLLWRWAPCAALVLGAVSFASFVTLAVPDHIGQVAPRQGNGQLYAAALARGDSAPSANTKDDSGPETTNTVAATPALRSTTTPAPPSFPKRGFSPPLERVEAAPTPAQLALPQQPQLNVPPPVPAEAAAALSPQQPGVVPQPAATPAAAPSPSPAAAESAPAPAPSAEPATAAN